MQNCNPQYRYSGKILNIKLKCTNNITHLKLRNCLQFLKYKYFNRLIIYFLYIAILIFD